MAKETECTEFLLPVHDAMDILGGKWKIPLILYLSLGKRRFKEMERGVGITAKMLSKELKDLEINGLVKRTVYDTLPVSVEYSITEYGKSLEKVILSIRAWGVQHRKKVTGKVK